MQKERTATSIKRILVVDDDPALRGSLQDCLKDEGYEVETAENGRKALSRLGDAAYDVMVFDCRMPELSGLTVLRHLQLTQSSLLVVMMASEQASEPAAESLVALGAQACLFKPFDLGDIEEVLESASAAFSLGLDEFTNEA